MVVTFPHMGNTYIAAKALFDGLKIPYVVPSQNNKVTLQRGAFYSPEEICLPFKIMLGNYIESIEKGADTILIAGSCGPCRFGEYCELHMKILKKMGYDNLEFIVIDPPASIGFGEFKKRIGKVGNASSLSTAEKFKALPTVMKILNLADKFEARARILAGYEVQKGQCRRLLATYRAEVLRCSSAEESLELLKSYMKKLEGIEVDRTKKPLKIALIGEIYTIIDPFSNLHVEDKLMDYGVCTYRLLSPSWWLKDAILKPMKLNSIELNREARRYLPYNVGGHGRECVGEAALSQRKGMDAAIQVFPLGCMPEVIAKSVLQNIRREKDFPILTLIVDEITGEAGYVTRLEAFLDMLEFKKNKGQIALKELSY